jgi:hypothetical protein
MAWYLAEIREGIDGVAAFATGRHCYVSRTLTGVVRVIAANGVTAVVKLGEARRRLRVVRDTAGNPIPVSGQGKREMTWHAREARRFDGRRCLAA